MLGYLFLASIAFIIAFILTRIIVFIHLIVIAPFRRKKIVEKGDYKTVVAEQITRRVTQDEKGYYHLWFKYTVDGKEYKTNVTTRRDDSSTMTLYYCKNPSIAFGNINRLGGIEYPHRITGTLTVLFFLIIVLVYKLNGM